MAAQLSLYAYHNYPNSASRNQCLFSLSTRNYFKRRRSLQRSHTFPEYHGELTHHQVHLSVCVCVYICVAANACSNLFKSASLIKPNLSAVSQVNPSLAVRVCVS